VYSLQWSAEAKQQYDRLKAAAMRANATRRKTGKSKSSKQEGLFRQVHKALSYLAQNPRHRSLQTHKYRSVIDPSGKKRDTFEAYCQNDTPGAYRIFWCYGPGKKGITILAITAHP